MHVDRQPYCPIVRADRIRPRPVTRAKFHRAARAGTRGLRRIPGKSQLARTCGDVPARHTNLPFQFKRWRPDHSCAASAPEKQAMHVIHAECFRHFPEQPASVGAHGAFCFPAWRNFAQSGPRATCGCSADAHEPDCPQATDFHSSDMRPWPSKRKTRQAT